MSENVNEQNNNFSPSKTLDENRMVDALITRCLRGDQSAFTALYERYASGIYRLCYSLVPHQQEAEDVVQEVFVYAFKNLQRYDSRRAAFRTWLYTIAVSRCRNTYRRKQLPQIELGNLFRNEVPGPQSETPEAVLAQQVAQDALLRALAALPHNLREAVVLRYGHGLTYREIADVMDCPLKTAESRVRLAHVHLRKALKPQGQGLLEELLSF
ncbi:MAG: RNA polymerase sigma factor [Phototrophicaceae bacterium]